MFRKPIIDIPEEYRPAIDELPGDLQRIAAVIEEVIPEHGVRITLILAQAFPGHPVYFRNPVKVIAAYRDNAMRAEYDRGGITAKELAIKTGLSLRYVEKILAMPSSQEELEERQFRLF